MMRQKQAVNSSWVVTPSIRDPLILPPDVRGAAHIVAVVRALLLDDRLPARDEYRAMVDLMRPEIQDIQGDTLAFLTAGRLPRHIYDFKRFRQVDSMVRDFSRHWLFGSETGQLALWGLVTVDAYGANPLAIDWQRAEHSEVWKAVYRPTTRPSRRKHRELMTGLKRGGWRLLKDPELLDTARDWVECHHVSGGLSAWVKSRGEDYERLGTHSRRFASIDNALGIRRKPGRPPV